MRIPILLLLTLAVFSMGCGHDRRPPGEGRGRPTGPSVSDSPDGGDGIVLLGDAGASSDDSSVQPPPPPPPPPRVDAGSPPPEDSGSLFPPADSGTTGPVCSSDYVQSVSGAYCSAATADCMNNCPDNACASACLDADPNPDCSACVNVNFISCGNAAGCQSDWDAYSCCIDTECGVEPTSTCITTAQNGACSLALEDYNVCLDMVDFSTACPNFVVDCF